MRTIIPLLSSSKTPTTRYHISSSSTNRIGLGSAISLSQPSTPTLTQNNNNNFINSSTDENNGNYVEENGRFIQPQLQQNKTTIFRITENPLPEPVNC